MEEPVSNQTPIEHAYPTEPSDAVDAPNAARDRAAALLSLAPGLGHLYKGHIMIGGLIFFVVGPLMLARVEQLEAENLELRHRAHAASAEAERRPPRRDLVPLRQEISLFAHRPGPFG